MFVLRNVTNNDLNDLYELSGKVQFINLPHDKDIIKNKIERSQECFITPSKRLEDNYYFFVLEDLSINKVIGVSMIHAQHGTEKEPHFYLKVSSEHKFSQTINTGFVHGTLKLGLNTDGPTEIGGLVLSPEYRGNNEKLGKQMSFVRFLYMAMNPQNFKETVHSELMPPLDPDGNSPLWEAIGRRFINMDYQEADRLSRNNKEFILSLFPSDNIYMSLLTPHARNAIGKVGKDTVPVKNMLEKIGFQYTGEVDPFDGGPHYRAKLKDLTIVQDFKKAKVIKEINSKDFVKRQCLLSFDHKKYSFYSIRSEVLFNPLESTVVLNEELYEQFNINEGQEVAFIPFN